MATLPAADADATVAAWFPATRTSTARSRRTAPPAPPGDGAAPAAPAGDAGSLANAITAGVAKSIRRLPARGPRPPPPTCIGAPTGSAPHLAAGAVVVDDLVPSQTRPEPGTARQRGSRQHPDQPVAANRRCPAESFRAPPPPSPSPSTTFGAVPGGDRPPGPDRSPDTGTSAKSTSVRQIRCSDPRTTWVPVVNGPPVSRPGGREGGGRVSGSGVDHIAGVSGSRSSVS